MMHDPMRENCYLSMLSLSRLAVPSLTCVPRVISGLYNHGVPAGPHTNPFQLHPDELLYPRDVLSGVVWKLLPLPHLP